ncbi:MAG: hypothetical protein V3T11_10025 [Roseateles sp.]
MALQWDVSKIKNHEKVTTVIKDGEEHWHPVTDKLVWGCMSAGMGEITEDNWKTFLARLTVVESLWGCKTLTTAAEVYAHIGLEVNVYDDETDDEWALKIVKRELASRIRNANAPDADAEAADGSDDYTTVEAR